jgi:regulator of cell morphogenesis and NO signaling
MNDKIDIIDLNETVGNLSTLVPGSTSIFRKYDIDFCCGGDNKLIDVCGENETKIKDELTALKIDNKTQFDISKADNKEIVNYILDNFHAKHRERLPEILLMAKTVERVHAGHADCPINLASRIEALSDDLEMHMQREEQVLFPFLLKNTKGIDVTNSLAVMESEHQSAGEDLRFIEEATNKFTPPTGACTTWCALYKNLEDIVNDLMLHVHIENNILFPRISK